MCDAHRKDLRAARTSRAEDSPTCAEPLRCDSRPDSQGHAPDARAHESSRLEALARIGRRALVSALSIGALAAASVGEAAESIAGPKLGNVRYQGAIRTTPEGEDEDAFAGGLLAGERLTLRIVTAFHSGLLPELVVEGPDGRARNVRMRSYGIGKVVELRNWRVPESGRWTVRVRPLFETQGPYTLSIAIRRSETARVAVRADRGGATPADVDVPFEGIDGARLVLTARSAGRGALHISELIGPSGGTILDAGGAPVVGRAKSERGTATLSIGKLAAGDGTYRARITAPAGHRAFVVTARVVPAARPNGARTLSGTEPWVAPRTTLLRSVKERRVRIDGRGFSTNRRPVVLFGDRRGTEVIVEPYGTYLDVTPPQLDGGSTVRVAVVNPDGQASERPAYFYYVTKPRVDDVVDLQGAAVRGSSTSGGRRVRFVGAGFETGVYVRFGASADVLPQILAAGEMELKVPAQPEGIVEIHLLDGYLHDVVVPIPFEYKAPPQVDPAPYQPASVAGDGTGQVVITGSGFDQDDRVIFDGSLVATQWLSPFGVRFTVPATTAGLHSVSVRDRVRTEVACPKLLVQ